MNLINGDSNYALPQFVIDKTNELEGSFNAQEFEHVVKVLKRELKGELNHTKLDAIQSQTSKLGELFEQAKTDNVSMKPSVAFSKLNERLSQRQTIFHGKEKIQKIEGSTSEKIEMKGLEAKFKASEATFSEVSDNYAFKDFCPKLSKIYERICLRNERISVEDYDFVNHSLGHLSELEISFTPQEIGQIKNCLEHCKQAIENAALNKIKLLGVLQDKIEKKESVTGLEREYILSNPFEIQMDLRRIASKMKLQDIAGVLNLPQESGLVTNKIESLLAKIMQSNQPHTFADKLECLKFLIENRYVPEGVQKGEVLISGGGPGGLMSALIALMQGYSKVTVLEARGAESKMRQNIVALGKEDDLANQPMFENNKLAGKNPFGSYVAADLQLLDFFGVTDCLKEKGAVDAEKSEGLANILEVRIEDIQKGLLEVAKGISTESKFSIQYNASIEEIGKNEEGKAIVQYKTHEGKITCSPDIVYVMEGYRTKTRDLLGIDVIKESKVSRMGFSFYEMKENRKTVFQFLETVKLYFDVGIRALQIGIKFITNRERFLDEITTITKLLGRGELLLSTPDLQYFYFTMTVSEEKRLKEFEGSLKAIKEARNNWADQVYSHLGTLDQSDENVKMLVEKFKPSARPGWIDDPDENMVIYKALKELFPASDESLLDSSFLKDVNKLNQKIDKFLKDIQRKDYLINMLAYRSLDIKQVETDTEYKETIAASSQVQRAEKNHIEIGNTHFVLGGDSQSATDPLSGAGMRTTFLRAAISTIAFSENLASDSLSQAFYHDTAEKEAKSMREEGLHARQKYRLGTERLERYLSTALEKRDIDQEQYNTLLSMQGKYKSMKEGLPISFTVDEKLLMDKLEVDLRKGLLTKLNISEDELTSSEHKLLMEIIAPDWTPDLNKSSQYRTLFSKIPFLGKEYHISYRQPLIQRGAQAALLLFIAECKTLNVDL